MLIPALLATIRNHEDNVRRMCARKSEADQVLKKTEDVLKKTENENKMLKLGLVFVLMFLVMYFVMK